jgi:hypothetical protein
MPSVEKRICGLACTAATFRERDERQYIRGRSSVR